jgi:general secretion pathway protein I
MRVRRHKPRKGMSLLEVLTALTIFLFSVVLISQMVTTSSRMAVESRRLTQAALLCESKIGELVSGVLPLETTPAQPIPEADEHWTYEVNCEPQEWTTVPIDGQSIPGLNIVHVTVVWQTTQGTDRLEYTLSRVILDPRVRVPAPQQSTSSSSSSTTSQ